MKRALYDLLYGLHSRIPLCCIVEFLVFGGERMADLNEGYAMCRGCSWLSRRGVRRRITIHHCSPYDPGCRRWADGRDAWEFINGKPYRVITEIWFGGKHIQVDQPRLFANRWQLFL